MPYVFRGAVVTCWRQLAANPAVGSSKPTRDGSNFTNRGKKCNFKRLLIDIKKNMFNQDSNHEPQRNINN